MYLGVVDAEAAMNGNISDFVSSFAPATKQSLTDQLSWTFISFAFTALLGPMFNSCA
jgi:hypothetical protein